MNPYVIPGLQEKIDYIENKQPGFKLNPQVQIEILKRIYRKVCKHLNIPPDTDSNSRKTEACRARHWTLFIAKCKGFSNSQVSDFFGKDPSNSQHAVGKIINEITLYPQSREAFEYFINEESLMISHAGLKNTILKKWLNDYYNHYKKEMQLITADTKKSVQSEILTEVKSMLVELFPQEDNLYQHIITSRDRDMVNKLIDKLDKIANNNQNNSSDSTHIII